MKILPIILIGLAHLSLQAQSPDTCLTRQSFDSLKAGYDAGLKLHQSGFIDTLIKKNWVQQQLIESIGKVQSFDQVICNAIKDENKNLKLENRGLYSRIKGLKFQISVGVGMAGIIGYSLGVLKK